MADASFSSSLIVGSAATSFSNCSSGMSGRTFLPSGPIATLGGLDGRRPRRRRRPRLGRRGLLGGRGLLGRRRGLLRRRGLGRAVGGGLLGRAPSWPAAVAVFLVVAAAATRGRAHVDVHRDAQRAQVREQRLEVARLDLRRPHWPGVRPPGLRLPTRTLLDQSDDRRVGEHLLGDLARVRGDTNTSSIMTGGTGQGGARTGSGRGTTRCRQEPRCSFCHADQAFPHRHRVPECVLRSRVDDVRRGSALRRSRAEGQPASPPGSRRRCRAPTGTAAPPRVAVDRSGRRVGSRCPRRGQPYRSSDLGLGGDLDRVRTLRARDAHRLAVLADQAQPELEPLVGPVPRHVELDRDRRRRAPARHAPAAAVDVQLPFSDHGVVGQQHVARTSGRLHLGDGLLGGPHGGYLHEREPTR